MPAVTYTPMPDGTRVIHRCDVDGGYAELWHLPGGKTHDFLKVVRKYDAILDVTKFSFTPNEPVIVPMGYHEGKTCFFEMVDAHA